MGRLSTLSRALSIGYVVDGLDNLRYTPGMGKHIGLTPQAARIAVIRASGNIRAAARALNASDSSVRYQLSRAEPAMARVRVEVPVG